MKSSLRNRFLVLALVLSTAVLQHGAFAESKHSPFDTVLVVESAAMAFPKTNDDPDTTKQRFIPFRDQLTVVDVILEMQAGQDFGPNFFNVEIIRGHETIQLAVDLKQLAHHPSPPAADTFLKQSDVLIIRPRIAHW